jgi:hypothetical protein
MRGRLPSWRPNERRTATFVSRISGHFVSLPLGNSTLGGRRARTPANYAAVSLAWVNADCAAEAAAYLFGCSSSDVHADRRSAEESELRAQCDLLRDILGNQDYAPTTGQSPVAQCDLLRDILGNPFQPPRFDQEWRTAVVLEDAGAPGELVAHLRGPGPHVRGCHAVDLCLGLT